MGTGVTLYQSTDTSAPVLTGQAGSLTSLLDAILVNGYGAKSAAGWTKPFTATNQRSYLQGAKTNFLQSYLHVDDNAPLVANEARVCGSEAAVTTGFINPTTSNIQKMPNGGGNYVVWRKSATADATARPWVAVADSRTLVLFINSDAAGVYFGYYFGDFFSFIPGDQGNICLMGRFVDNNGIIQNDAFANWNYIGDNNGLGGSNGFPVAGAIFVGRSVVGQGTSIRVAKHYDVAKFSAAPTYALPYPNLDGRLHLSYAWLHEWRQNALRGYLRGFWQPLHFAQSVTDRDTFTGAVGTSLVNRSFLVLKGIPYQLAGSNDPGNSATSAFAVLETSDTWDTN